MNPLSLPSFHFHFSGNGSDVKVGDGEDLSDPSSSSSASPNGSATAAERRKVTRKKKLKDIGKIAAINGASCYSSMRTGPPVITITTPDEAPVLSNQHPLADIERDSELGVGGGEVELFSDATNSERDSRQMIAPTSSPSAGGGISGYQHQLPASHFMNDHNSMTSPASTSAPPSSSMVQNHHLALTYYTHHEHLHPVLQQQRERRVSELPSPQYRSTITSTSQEQASHVYPIPIRARDAIATTLSALYGKLIVVMGIAFPMAEVISTYIPPSFYEVGIFLRIAVQLRNL